ncbi:auxin-responsive protein SAUR36-like [Hordeum vulgare]|nr:auxin-responsive protein SAUR36-like [Hordeum vulgare]
MIHPKKLAQLAKKWQRKVAAGAGGQQADECCSTTSIADKGHCVVYTTDGVRFEVPLAYLGTAVFGELLRMAGEEFGFTSSEGGRITLPCDATVMEYVLCLVRRDASEEVERAFLSSIALHCHGQDASMGLTHQFALCT